MATERLLIMAAFDFHIETIQELRISHNPVLDRQGQFRKWERTYWITIGNPISETQQGMNYRILPQDWKDLRRRLVHSYGRSFRIKKKTIADQKVIRQTGSGTEFRSVSAINWNYEVIHPPFAKIMEQWETEKQKEKEIKEVQAGVVK